MTAMNDAIGKSLSELLAKSPEKAIICILTDGAENASKEYTSEQVKELIIIVVVAALVVVHLLLLQNNLLF